MKIVYSTSQIYEPGGTERVLCTKANYLADVLGYDIHIVVLDNTKETFFHFSDKIQIHSLGIIKVKHKPWMIFGSRSRKEYQQKLFHKLDEIQPDITISLFGLDVEFLYKAKDRSKKIVEFHFSKNYLQHLGTAIPNDKYRFLRKIWMHILLKKDAYCASKYKHIVLLTEKDKRLWGGGNKYTVIPNPLSFQPTCQSTLENKKIIAVGSYTPQKGFDLLIEAFSLIAKEYPDWSLEIYGSGQDSEFLQNKINSLSLHNQVYRRKPEKNIEQEMAEASIFAFSSRYEGFGLVLTEAMACGLPCVSFDCECGPNEILKEGYSGFLVPSGNLSLFAEALKELMRNMDLRKKMGSQALQEVQRFYPENIMPLWIDLFKRVKDEDII